MCNVMHWIILPAYISLLHLVSFISKQLVLNRFLAMHYYIIQDLPLLNLDTVIYNFTEGFIKQFLYNTMPISGFYDDDDDDDNNNNKNNNNNNNNNNNIEI